MVADPPTFPVGPPAPATWTPSTYSTIPPPACWLRVNTTWCHPLSFKPPVLDTMELLPIPATTLPSERSETPKSVAVPLRSALTSPAPPVQEVLVPMPCDDRNQNSTEKLLGTSDVAVT